MVLLLLQKVCDLNKQDRHMSRAAKGSKQRMASTMLFPQSFVCCDGSHSKNIQRPANQGHPSMVPLTTVLCHITQRMLVNQPGHD